MCSTAARLDGKVVIVTGGSSGIGYEAARILAKKGARVVLAARNRTRLAAAARDIRLESGNNNVHYRTVDFASFKSIRNFANETLDAESRLDVLINNAGAIGLPDQLTEDGLNLTMQVNYFGAFLLTYLLLPMLRASAPSRVVTGTASTMYVGDIDFQHWTDVGRYNLLTSLSNSKLAVALFSAELATRLQGTGVTSNSFDPFVVPDTGVLENIPVYLRSIASAFVGIIGQRKEVVGEQIAYLAAAPELEQVTGKNYKFCTEWPAHRLARDGHFTQTLWERSKQVVQIDAAEDWEHVQTSDSY